MSQDIGQDIPASEPSLQASLESSTASTPMTDGDGEVLASSPAQPVQQAQSQPSYDWQGVVDYAKQQGVDLPYRDDVSAIQGLLQAYQQGQQRNYYADLGYQIAPYADQVQAWIKQNAIQQSQPAQAPSWQPPEWDARWVGMVERDPQTGTLRSKQGFDPRIADKVQAYADWRDKFLDNPGQMLQPMVEHHARELVKQELASLRQTSNAEQIVQQNASWMFQSDAQGNPTILRDGSRALSPAGQLYANQVNDIWNSGLHDVNRVHTLARQAVENAVLRQQWLVNQGRPQTSQASQQMGQVEPQVTGTAPRPAGAPKAPRGSAAGQTLREALNAKLNGFSDEDAEG